MCTLFANLYMLSTWGPHVVYMGSPYIFYIYMIKCGWLGHGPLKASRVMHYELFLCAGVANGGVLPLV